MNVDFESPAMNLAKRHSRHILCDEGFHLLPRRIIMGSEDVAAGQAKQIKGKANDIAGAVTGNTGQQIKGKAQKAVGKVQEAVGKATSK
jgi:uncharacterized protein YjbJ (UPF0337 family)